MNAKLRYKAKKIKAVFFDIDDTLRAKASGYIPDSIPTIFKALKEQGLLTGIASGRAWYGVVDEIKFLHPDYFVLLNGAYVRDGKGKELLDEPLSVDTIERFVSWCKQEKICYGFAGKDQPVLSEQKDFVEAIMQSVYGDCEIQPEFYKQQAVYQMWTFSKDNALLELPTDLANQLRCVPWHPHASDVLPLNMSKASGLSAFLEKTGLKADEVLFFGDGQNDLEMFDCVGLSIAMGNAVDELKEKADYVTSTLENHGIAQALQELGLIKAQLALPQLQLTETENPKAVIKTNKGDLELILFPDLAPKAVTNFLRLAEQGYYDNTIFHRVISDFMIQGGDPTGTGMGGQSSYGEAFEDEFSKELYHLRGALSMANSGPNTNGSQFFIVQNQSLPYSSKELTRAGWPKEIADAYAKNGGTPHLDNRHTVFGQLVGEDSYCCLDMIAATKTDLSDKPIETILIKTIEVKQHEDR